jgi:hypothetical protein
MTEHWEKIIEQELKFELSIIWVGSGEARLFGRKLKEVQVNPKVNKYF